MKWLSVWGAGNLVTALLCCGDRSYGSYGLMESVQHDQVLQHVVETCYPLSWLVHVTCRYGLLLTMAFCSKTELQYHLHGSRAML